MASHVASRGRIYWTPSWRATCTVHRHRSVATIKSHATAPQPLGPPFRALPFLTPSPGAPIVLTERQRKELTRIGSRVRLPARATVYHEGAAATALYAVTDGGVKAYRDMPSGKRSVCSFLFKGDLFGLAEKGRYRNSTQTITATALVRLPLPELAAILKRDAELQFEFLVKVTHELRESQRRAILITRRDAPGRLAMFVALMAERMPHVPGRPNHVVMLPMSRQDIAGFLSLSIESVSRATARLEHRGLVRFEGRHVARVIDPAGLARLVAAV